jgi:hypothetical protein
MRLRIGRETFDGPAVDLPMAVSPARLAAAVRTGEAHLPDGRVLSVTAPTPHPLHERLGIVRRGMGLRTRTALADAGRTRRLATPHDHAIARAEAALATPPDPVPEATAERKAAADAGADIHAARERVAELRGRVQALRERDLDAADLEARLREATKALAEAETEARAATQRHERAVATARERRAARTDRLRREDRLANRRRKARAHLVDRLRDEFERALQNLPDGPSTATVRTDPFAVGPVSAALAVARVATLRAPVVLAADRFDSAAAAWAWLDIPVIRCSG